MFTIPINTCKTPRQTLLVSGSALAFALLSTPAQAHFCWAYSAQMADPNHQIPWTTSDPRAVCTETNGLHPNLSMTGQLIGDTHRNWHCTFPATDSDAYGRAFLSFHRQLIWDFDQTRVSLGYPRIEIWDAYENAIVPGNDEDNVVGYTHCQSSGGTRPAGAQCTGCSDLPSDFEGAALGTNFSSLGQVGNALEGGPSTGVPFGWHGSYHNGVAALGCADVGGFIYTTYDPAFWMAHKKLDEIARDWQELQAADVVIVLDRSGSMDDNCDCAPGCDTIGNPPSPGSACAIEDAKDAAKMFADIVSDLGAPGGQQHRIGLVSYGSTATPSVGLTEANALAGFDAAVNPINAGGATSIGAGVREALTMLATAPNPRPHQAILVLTDGLENTPPCLEGADAPCVGVGADVISAAEIGDVQFVAIGFGPGAEEYHLQRFAEAHGGLYTAEQDFDATMSLQKYFVNAYGYIFDPSVSADPIEILPAGAQASERFEIPVCGADDQLSVIMGYQEDREAQCRLRLEVFTPSGAEVKLEGERIESRSGDEYHFTHLPLPLQGEHRGVWSARVVRDGDPRRCPAQSYFYSTMVRGLGQVKADPTPPVAVGRPLTVKFRLPESTRPADGWDHVDASVTVTAPDGSVKSYPLYDDGTHGDKLPGNNYWTLELPEPTRQLGTYEIHGRFKLTEAGCSRNREAMYSARTIEPPRDCLTPVCGQLIRTHAGDFQPIQGPMCVANQCAEPVRVELALSDRAGWLRGSDGKGGWVPVPRGTVDTGVVAPGDMYCVGDPTPWFAEVPAGAKPGESTIISSSIVSGHGQKLSCETRLAVGEMFDCNKNGIPDPEDLNAGTSADRNLDGRPDECGGPDDGVFGHPDGKNDGDAKDDSPGSVCSLSSPQQPLSVLWALVLLGYATRTSRRRKRRAQ